MQSNIFARNDEGFNKLEMAFIGLASFIFVLLLKDILFFGRRMFSHDTIWFFGLAQYFYNSVMHGVFPYWDIYNYCGQPFYYNLGIARIMEPSSMIWTGLAKLFDCSLLSLYLWDYISKIFISALGVYLAFRQTNRFVFSNFVVFASFLFSSLTMTELRQGGVLTSFIWTPWIMWFFFRLFKTFDLYNIIGLSLFAGLSVASYQAGYVFAFFQVFILSLFINHRDWLRQVFLNGRKAILLLFGALIIFLLSLHVLAVFIEKDRNVPVLRQILTTRSSNDYSVSSGEKPLLPADFLGLVSPPLAAKLWQKEWVRWLSEFPLYIGIVPFLLALFGIFFSRSVFRLNFMITLGVIGLLSLELKFWMGPVGDILFPFLRYARHMGLFQPFLVFVIVYFVGQGTDVLIQRYILKDNSIKRL